MARAFSRRSFLRTAALGSAGLALGSRIRAQTATLSRKPNLLVFLPDQQRADTIACYGADHVLAPNLDKLASQSFVFEQAYVTHPVCTPSRSSLMTGTWPHTNACTHNEIRLETHFRCLPEMIDDTDYRTAYMGKWHLGDEVFAQHGFEEWISILDGHQATFGASRDQKAVSDYSKFLASKGLNPDDKHGAFSRDFASKLPLELSKPQFLETRVCDFLAQHRRDPFVLFVAFFEPHPPYYGPLNNEHPLDQIDIEPTLDQTFAENMPLRYRLRQEQEKKNFGASPVDYLRIKQRYLGLVTEIDRSIGVILARLEELGLADNTIVVHTSDHGDMMGAHRLFGKTVLFQEAARVPYLIRMPEQRQTISIPQKVSHIDFVPTMLDLLGKAPHEQCAGQSRAPLLRGESMAAETTFLEWSPGKKQKISKSSKLADPEKIQRAMNESTRAAISSDGWKLCLRDTDKNELYNLRADPREEHNLYDNSAQKDVIRRLTREIHRWQESVGDSVNV
jgi:arylsulfatase A-like enzyme